jgi:hypothetical protein
MVEVLVNGEGEPVRISMSEIGNVGEFVAASLELERWQRDMNIVGSTMGIDEIVTLAQEVRGRKFDVITLAPQDLIEQLETLEEKDFLKKM